MSSNLILSCPFCHQKGEYRDAPPNSTVRCDECHSVFRVPANAFARHKPGTVLKGEETAKRGGSLKVLVILLLLAVIAVSGYYIYAKVFMQQTQVKDPWGKEAKWGLDTAPGVVERFMLSWKHEDMDRMLTYCRLEDQQKMKEEKEQEWRASVFGGVQLTSFEVKGYTPVEGTLGEYLVNFEGIDKNTKSPLRGVVKAVVFRQEVKTPEGKRAHLGVDLHIATPTIDW